MPGAKYAGYTIPPRKLVPKEVRPSMHSHHPWLRAVAPQPALCNIDQVQVVPLDDCSQ